MRTRTKRIVALLAGTAMLGSSFASFAATDVAANDLAYKGELEIMHYSTSEESEGNGGFSLPPTMAGSSARSLGTVQSSVMLEKGAWVPQRLGVFTP